MTLSGGPIRAPVVLNHNFLEGLLARVSGDAAAAHAAFTAARTEQEKVVRTQPDYGPAVCAPGLIDAGSAGKKTLYARAAGRSSSCRLPKMRPEARS